MFTDKQILTTESPYPSGSERERIEWKFKDLIHERLHFSSEISYEGNKNIPFLRIYRYEEAFSFNFVRDLLRQCKANSNDYVFDPFSGLGTTLFTSMSCGLPSIGIDKLPLACFISKTLPLLPQLKANELTELWASLIPQVPGHTPSQVALDVPIMKVAFDEGTLTNLRKLKSSIEELDLPYRDIFLLLFFSILEECSLISRHGRFLRVTLTKTPSDPVEAMNRKVLQVEEDLHRTKLLFGERSLGEKFIPEVYLGDTRDLTNIKFKKKPTLLITGPPYPDGYDFTKMYSLELCFHFVKNLEEFKAIRSGILRSHIESKTLEGDIPSHPVIQEVVDVLNERSPTNPKIPNMITAYFVDMQQAIKEWSKVLDQGAKVAMVVYNVRFGDEMVPVDLVLSEIAEEEGFTIKEIMVARYKDNSSQQMKKYGKIPVRESIVIWEK